MRTTERHPAMQPWGGSTPLVSVACGGTPDVAIPIAMTPAEHVPLAEVKNRLSEVVDRLEHEHGRVVITKHGRPAAVMLSLEDLESLERGRGGVPRG
jgi:prevent-host-death family protein